MNIQKLQAGLYFFGAQKELTVFETKASLRPDVTGKFDNSSWSIDLEPDGDTLHASVTVWNVSYHNGDIEDQQVIPTAVSREMVQREMLKQLEQVFVGFEGRLEDAKTAASVRTFLALGE